MAEGIHCLEEGEQMVLLNVVDVKYKAENSKQDILSLKISIFLYYSIETTICFI